jgi:hypothetical protein
MYQDTDTTRWEGGVDGGSAAHGSARAAVRAAVLCGLGRGARRHLVARHLHGELLADLIHVDAPALVRALQLLAARTLVPQLSSGGGELRARRTAHGTVSRAAARRRGGSIHAPRCYLRLDSAQLLVEGRDAFLGGRFMS